MKATDHPVAELAFTEHGLLPPGDYELSIEELRNSLLVVGPIDKANCPHWDEPWRRYLVDQLAILCRQLWAVGVTDIFVDGSFAEDKEHPNDIDGYFVCDMKKLASGELQSDLNFQHSDKIWTWEPDSRKAYRGYPKRQLPMWHKHRVELYPHVGQPAGIPDENGNDQEFPAAFRKTRGESRPKGIIKIKHEGEAA